MAPREAVYGCVLALSYQRPATPSEGSSICAPPSPPSSSSCLKRRRLQCLQTSGLDVPRRRRRCRQSAAIVCCRPTTTAALKPDDPYRSIAHSPINCCRSTKRPCSVPSAGKKESGIDGGRRLNAAPPTDVDLMAA